MFLGSVVSVVASAIPLPLTGPFDAISLVSSGGPILIILGLLGCLIGMVRRSMFSYLISERDVIVQKQLLRRSIRRIPFSSISDLQVSLVHGMDRAENVVQEMVNVPKPDKIADLIMSSLCDHKSPNRCLILPIRLSFF